MAFSATLGWRLPYPAPAGPANLPARGRAPAQAGYSRLDAAGNALSAQRSYENGTQLGNSGLDLLSRYVLGRGTFSATLDLSWFPEYEIEQAVTPLDTLKPPNVPSAPLRR